MNINFLIKKKHIFKQRFVSTTKYTIKNYLNHAIYSTNAFRFEFVYLKTIKKLFRKKYIKRKALYLHTKFWIMIKPNFLLTAKSKNSRMGSGVGLYLRVCSRIHSNTPIIFFKYYPKAFILACLKYLKKKLNLTFLIR